MTGVSGRSKAADLGGILSRVCAEIRMCECVRVSTHTFFPRKRKEVERGENRAIDYRARKLFAE